MSNISIKPVDSFPTITRSRASEDLQQIIDTLLESSNTGQIFSIENVEAGNAYNSMQQRIRTQAKKHGLKVMISFDKSTNTLYYKATSAGREKVAVKPVENVVVESAEISEAPEKPSRTRSSK